MKIGDRVAHVKNPKSKGTILDIDGLEVAVKWELERWDWMAAHHPNELQVIESTRKEVESA